MEALKRKRLQEIIKENSDWQRIISSPPFNLKVERKGHLFMITYQRGKVSFGLPAVEDARGCVVDNNGDYMCRPLRAFYNYGAPFAHDIQMESATIEEKLDGSFIKVWRDRKTRKMYISTNRTIDASKTMVGVEGGKSFQDLFTESLSDIQRERLEEMTICGMTHMFELMTPENIVVVPHNEYKVAYLGTVINNSGREYRETYLSDVFETPRQIENNFKNLDEVKKWVNEQNAGDSFEGVVVRDRYARRVKIKADEYVKRHYYRTSRLDDEAILWIVAQNEKDEWITYFPETESKIVDMEKKYKGFLDRTISAMKKIINRYDGDRASTFKYLHSFDLHPHIQWWYTRVAVHVFDDTPIVLTRNNNKRVLEAMKESDLL